MCWPAGKEAWVNVDPGHPPYSKTIILAAAASGRLQGDRAFYGPAWSLRSFQSPDGIHWSLISDAPVITDGAFDSQNLAFWDAARGEYRAYWRIFNGGTTDKQN